MPSFKEIIQSLDGALIVSSQASTGEPLDHPSHILAMCLSAINGGASALRLEGTANVAYVRKHCDELFVQHVPIVGLIKAAVPAAERLSCAYITASFADCCALAEAGADIIALDATSRKRADDHDLEETILKVHQELDRLVWADCATFAEAINAAECGADIISTTLYGYTAETALPKEAGPSFELLSELIDHLDRPVILEGRVWHPDELTRAFEIGAHAVVVGSAITRPQLITERFVKAIPARRARQAAFALKDQK